MSRFSKAAAVGLLAVGLSACATTGFNPYGKYQPPKPEYSTPTKIFVGIASAILFKRVLFPHNYDDGGDD